MATKKPYSTNNNDQERHFAQHQSHHKDDHQENQSNHISSSRRNRSIPPEKQESSAAEIIMELNERKEEPCVSSDNHRHPEPPQQLQRPLPQEPPPTPSSPSNSTGTTKQPPMPKAQRNATRPLPASSARLPPSWNRFYSLVYDTDKKKSHHHHPNQNSTGLPPQKPQRTTSSNPFAQAQRGTTHPDKSTTENTPRITPRSGDPTTKSSPSPARQDDKENNDTIRNNNDIRRPTKSHRYPKTTGLAYSRIATAARSRRERRQQQQTRALFPKTETAVSPPEEQEKETKMGDSVVATDLAPGSRVTKQQGLLGDGISSNNSSSSSSLSAIMDHPITDPPICSSGGSIHSRNSLKTTASAATTKINNKNESIIHPSDSLPTTTFQEAITVPSSSFITTARFQPPLSATTIFPHQQQNPPNMARSPSTSHHDNVPWKMNDIAAGLPLDPTPQEQPHILSEKTVSARKITASLGRVQEQQTMFDAESKPKIKENRRQEEQETAIRRRTTTTKSILASNPTNHPPTSHSSSSSSSSRITVEVVAPVSPPPLHRCCSPCQLERQELQHGLMSSPLVHGAVSVVDDSTTEHSFSPSSSSSSASAYSEEDGAITQTVVAMANHAVRLATKAAPTTTATAVQGNSSLPSKDMSLSSSFSCSIPVAAETSTSQTTTGSSDSRFGSSPSQFLESFSNDDFEYYSTASNREEEIEHLFWNDRPTTKEEREWNCKDYETTLAANNDKSNSNVPSPPTIQLFWNDQEVEAGDCRMERNKDDDKKKERQDNKKKKGSDWNNVILQDRRKKIDPEMEDNQMFSQLQSNTNLEGPIQDAAALVFSPREQQQHEKPPQKMKTRQALGNDTSNSINDAMKRLPRTQSAKRVEVLFESYLDDNLHSNDSNLKNNNNNMKSKIQRRMEQQQQKRNGKSDAGKKGVIVEGMNLLCTATSADDDDDSESESHGVKEHSQMVIIPTHSCNTNAWLQTVLGRRAFSTHGEESDEDDISIDDVDEDEDNDSLYGYSDDNSSIVLTEGTTQKRGDDPIDNDDQGIGPLLGFMEIATGPCGGGKVEKDEDNIALPQHCSSGRNKNNYSNQPCSSSFDTAKRRGGRRHDIPEEDDDDDDHPHLFQEACGHNRTDVPPCHSGATKSRHTSSYSTKQRIKRSGKKATKSVAEEAVNALFKLW